MEGLFSFLPMPFWEGPPLPRFLGVTWTSLLGGFSPAQSTAPLDFLPKLSHSLSNEEVEEIERDSKTGFILRRRVIRNVKEA